MKFVTCTDCEFAYDANKAQACPHCGSSSSKARKAGKAPGHPLGYPQCAWEADGRRCRYPGTLTSSTMPDANTRWFCSGHHECMDPLIGADIVQASQDYQHVSPKDRTVLQQKAGAFCTERGLKTQAQNQPAIGKRARDVSWAHKILERVAAGDLLPLISVEMARSALPREPGDE